MQPVETLFSGRPAVRVSPAQAKRFCNGGALGLERTSLAQAKPEDGAIFRVLSPDGEFLGLGAVALSSAELAVLRLFC